MIVAIDSNLTKAHVYVMLTLVSVRITDRMLKYDQLLFTVLSLLITVAGCWRCGFNIRSNNGRWCLVPVHLQRQQQTTQVRLHCFPAR